MGLPRAHGRPYGCSPHVGSIQCTRREGWGIARSRVRLQGSSMAIAAQVCAYGIPRDLRKGSPWRRRWRMDGRGEGVRRAEGEWRLVEVRGGAGWGLVRETSPMPGRQQPRCHRRGGAPARCSHELHRGTLPRGEEMVFRPPPLHISSIQQHSAQKCCSKCG